MMPSYAQNGKSRNVLCEPEEVSKRGSGARPLALSRSSFEPSVDLVYLSCDDDAPAMASSARVDEPPCGSGPLPLLMSMLGGCS